MKPAAGSGQAHVAKCSCHEVFWESPLLSSAVLPGMVLEGAGSWPSLRASGDCSSSLTGQTITFCAQAWVMVNLLAQTQQQATSRKKILILLIIVTIPQLGTMGTEVQLLSVPWCALSRLQSFRGISSNQNLNQLRQNGASVAVGTASLALFGGRCP